MIIAIVGRPNVGKSSLFNRIIGHKQAIVCDESGTTRDRVVGDGEWQGKEFCLVDTAGLFGELEAKDMEMAIERQIDMAVADADILLLVFDGKAPLNNIDWQIIKRLKKHMHKLVVVVNKMDSQEAKRNWESFNKISGVPKFGVSAISGQGVGDLLESILASYHSVKNTSHDSDEIFVSIIGRPNAGKSSLINQLAGSERMVVSETPGTTRDIGEIKILRGDQPIVFYDTAGVRSNRVLSRQKIEKYSYLRALRAMEMSDVVVLMIDAQKGVGKTEIRMINLVEEMGKGLVLFINKLDLMGEEEEGVESIMKDIRPDLYFLDWVPVVVGSALKDINIKALLKNIERVGENFMAEIKSASLMDLVQQIEQRVPRHEIDLQRIKQISSKPPTFLVGNIKKEPSCQTRRMLVAIIREAFSLTGVPIKIEFR